MSIQTIAAPRNSAFKIGWVALLVISALAALWHTAAVFVMRAEATLFLGWAAFNLYSTIVLYVPFRRGEKWAWYTSWILVIGFAAPILLIQEDFAVYYLGAAVVMAISLLLTRPAFSDQGGAS
jgi:uncharacterized membrane protein YhaH (DUF805 family)